MGEEVYLSNVCAYLADGGEEEEAGHPFIMRETGFAGEVVEVLDEAFEDVFQAGVGALRIDELDVVCYVVDCEVLEGRDVDLGGIHYMGC